MSERNAQERGQHLWWNFWRTIQILTSISHLTYKGPPLSGAALRPDLNLNKDCSELRIVFSTWTPKDFPGNYPELWPTSVTWFVTCHPRVWQASGSPWRNREEGRLQPSIRQGNTHSPAPHPAFSLLHILPSISTQCHVAGSSVLLCLTF